MADVMIMKEIEDKASLLGVDLSTLDLDSIRLPPGEDCGIVSDDEDVYQEENLEFDSGFSNIIVADNLPVVPKEKFEKLEGVVRKIYSQIGVIKDDGLWMPVDPVSEKEASQLAALLRDIKEGLDTVRHKIQSLIAKVKGQHPTADGFSYLEAKNLLLLNYCQSLVYYLL